MPSAHLNSFPLPNPNTFSMSRPKPCKISQPLSFFIFMCCLFLFLVIPSALSQADISAPMETGERDSLYSVIQSLVGKSWNGSDLFPDPCGWTPIEGISCDLYGDFWYVTAMSVGPVHDNSLQCTEAAAISSTLFRLKHLKSLSFFNCFTSWNHPQTVPTTNWEPLSHSLETLEFRGNPWLVGEIPASLGGLKKLNSLVLSENALEGAVPASLGGVAALKRLVLARNKLSGQVPTELGMLKDLLILDLSNNRLSGELPSTIGGLGSLLKLDLSSNSLSGMLPDQLGGMKNLTLLDLRNNSFSGGLPASLGELSLLEEMLVGSNPLVNGCLSVPWNKLWSLVTLDVSASKCVGSIPESLTGLKKLRFLALNDNSFIGGLPSKLAEMPAVSGMYLDGNNLSGMLDFPQEFFQRLGRKLVVWGNSNLCYPPKLPKSFAPYGVPPCKAGTLMGNYSKHQLVEHPNLPASGGSGVALRKGKSILHHGLNLETEQ
ncbi:Piriformospora indica-insensitive protein 2 [Nymphaea thermarum]|nr:Piriformospora indica-insensitive protein 2 [Nymphaea thermarum]